MKSPRILGILTTTALALGVLASPAQADYYSIADPDDAKASLTDITGITARHGSQNLVIKVRFAHLRRNSVASLNLFVDSDRARKGPEHVLGSGLGDGTDYALTRARRWKSVGRHVDCDYDLRIKWGQDRARARIDRECFKRAGVVRVAVQMTDYHDWSHPVTDWVPRARRWSFPIGAAEPATRD